MNKVWRVDPLIQQEKNGLVYMFESISPKKSDPPGMSACVWLSSQKTSQPAVTRNMY